MDAAITPDIEPQPEEPITERTRAMMNLHNQLQDVTETVKEIRELLKTRESKAERMMQAFKRAINQFISQL